MRKKVLVLSEVLIMLSFIIFLDVMFFIFLIAKLRSLGKEKKHKGFISYLDMFFGEV